VHDEGDAQGLEARLGLPAPAVGGLGDGFHDVGGVIADLGLGALKAGGERWGQYIESSKLPPY
jgi:hypothetical protein